MRIRRAAARAGRTNAWRARARETTRNCVPHYRPLSRRALHATAAACMLCLPARHAAWRNVCLCPACWRMLGCIGCFVSCCDRPFPMPQCWEKFCLHATVPTLLLQRAQLPLLPPHCSSHLILPFLGAACVPTTIYLSLSSSSLYSLSLPLLSLLSSSFSSLSYSFLGPFSPATMDVLLKEKQQRTAHYPTSSVSHFLLPIRKDSSPGWFLKLGKFSRLPPYINTCIYKIYH